MRKDFADSMAKTELSRFSKVMEAVLIYSGLLIPAAILAFALVFNPTTQDELWQILTTLF